MEQQKRWYLNNIPLKNETIADVGANVGAMSQFFWDNGKPRCRLVSIEPEPDNIKAIEKRIRRAKTKRWSLKRCAVSNFSGHVDMKSFDGGFGRNSMVSSGGDRRVACQPLAELVPGATVVKLDIEGHEYAVLPGALTAMPQVKVWAMELHMLPDHPLETTLTMFAEHGYELLGAGRQRDSPTGEWIGVRLPPTMSWQSVPGTESVVDGMPGVFKMLHVIARRP